MNFTSIVNKKTVFIVVLVALVLVIVGIVYASYSQKQVQSATDQIAATTSAEVSQNIGVVQQLVPIENKMTFEEFLKGMTGATSTKGTILVKPTVQIVQPIAK